METSIPRPARELDTPYEPPRLIDLGSVVDLTLSRCSRGKHLGVSDGFPFTGIGAPISNCSS